MFDLESAIIHAEKVYEEKLDERSYALEFHDNEEAEECQKCADEHRQLAEWLKELIERRKQPEIIYCKDCKYYGRKDKRRFYRGYDCLEGRIATIVPDRDFCSRAEKESQ